MAKPMPARISIAINTIARGFMIRPPFYLRQRLVVNEGLHQISSGNRDAASFRQDSEALKQLVLAGDREGVVVQLKTIVTRY